jgi:E3 ubiquitin-protein ligase HECTD2
MAPWTSRILSPNSRRDEIPQAAAGSPVRNRPSARLTEDAILDNAYGIPTLPSPSSSSSHRRSKSHPFPSLFAGKKNTGAKNKDAVGETEEEGELSPDLARRTAQNPTAKQAKITDKDLMTGKCMACDSMVRWPKELKVFRCTVCLTINDLKPVILEVRRTDGHRAPVSVKAGTYPESPGPQRSMFAGSLFQFSHGNMLIRV